MPELSNSVWFYFTPSHETFWKWSADHQAIEWRGGQTIAFRFELQTLMEQLVEEGLPPFENILLTVAACRNRSDAALHELPNMLSFSDYPMRYSMVETVGKVVERLEGLARLPEDLRTSIDGKGAILALITENGPLRKNPDFSSDCIEWLVLGYNIVPGAHSFIKTTNDWITELRGLHDGLAAVNEVAVRLRMQTGFEALPSPIPLNLPAPPPEPEPVPLTIRELLRELEQDEEHAGLVRLTQRLVAVVSLPRPMSSPDDQPLGGVSDITNRGPFDRLLLSELAQDSDVLMTRVALNEAMYIRREIPPAFPPRDRLVLVDAGIRMWGLPRLYATAAALALAVMQEDSAQTKLFRSVSNGILPIDLTTRDEIIDHLGSLELAVHPGEAISAFVAEADGLPTDFVIVTGEDVLSDPEFRQALNNHRLANLYLVAVTREGDLRLLQRTRQGERVLRQAKLDLNQILAGPAKTRPKLRDDSIDPRLPAILRVQPFPLYLDHQLDWDNCGVVHRGTDTSTGAPIRHVLSLTYDQRLTLWTSRDCGPIELSNQMPHGKLLWHTARCDLYETDPAWQVVVGSVQQGRLHLVQIKHCQTEVIPLALPPVPVRDVCEHAGVLYVVQARELHLFSLTTGQHTGAVPITADKPWIRGRFFGGPETYYAVAFDGQNPVWTMVHQEKSRLSYLKAIFDCQCLASPVAVDHDNTVKALGTNQPLKFQSRYSKPGKPVIEESRIGFEERPYPPHLITKVSPDGNRFVLSDAADSTSVRHGWIVDLESLTAVHSHGDAGRILSSVGWYVNSSKNLRNRFTLIATLQDQLLLMSTKGKFLGLNLASKFDLITLDETAAKRHEVSHAAEFVAIRSPDGVGFELKVATWADGSRAYLDSRGLLHLQSSSPHLPEMTFVLHETNMAGWSSDRFVWGDSSFTGPETGSEARITAERVFQNWLVPFCRKLR